MKQITSNDVKITQDLAAELGVLHHVFQRYGHEGTPYRAALAWCLRRINGYTLQEIADLTGYATPSSVYKQIQSLEGGKYDRKLKQATGSRLGAVRWCERFCRAWIKENA
jgi:hypothetical protein